jgi:GNAT superfamily N-acetyltransferase
MASISPAEKASMASTIVRPASTEDAALLTELFDEMFVHYWGDAAPDRNEIAQHVTRDILPSGCEIVIAEREGRAVGLATFAVLYPGPGLGGQLTMKDLFVCKEARSGGAGRALLQYLARVAMERGCLRLDWTTEIDNEGALTFYDRLGARRVPEKVYYRVDGNMLKQWAENGIAERG